jgi:hypothetical protein
MIVANFATKDQWERFVDDPIRAIKNIEELATPRSEIFANLGAAKWFYASEAAISYQKQGVEPPPLPWHWANKKFNRYDLVDAKNRIVGVMMVKKVRVRK